MDTDDLTEMAYGIVVRAARVSDTLKADLGARSAKYDSENDWLCGIFDYLQRIVEAPDEYVDYWNLAQEEGITPTIMSEIAAELSRRAKETLAKPLNQRGKQG